MRLFCCWIAAVLSLGSIQAAESITALEAKIDNVQLHYLTAGHGPATVILLPIGGDKSLGQPLADQMKLVANDVTVVIVKNAGHWVSEENPKETSDALINFL